MPIDRMGDPWPGTTYKGFSGGPAAPEPPRTPGRPAAPRRAPSTGVLMLGGVAAALALGVVFGLWARPELIGSRQAPAATPPTAAPGPIAINAAAAPEALPRAPTRLQTLPPDMAAASRIQAPPRAGAPSAPSAPTGPAAVPDAPAPPQAPEALEPGPGPAPGPGFRASFDCATARPGAEAVVCGDAGLAAADRRMARAYRRAMRSGVDPDDLRQEQRDWAAIREDAALRSREALAQVYDQRIEELDRIAERAPEDGD